MSINSAELLRQLGAGASIASLCEQYGMSRDDFDHWWKREAAARAPQYSGESSTSVSAAVSIERDSWGIPHIFASSNKDLWFGFGFAMAQDRLFQMDYLRRKGWGRLAEVLGPDGVPLDIIARTVGLNRIAREEMTRLPAQTRELLDAFSAGVNAWIESAGERLPIEFALLDYRPEPWSAEDCVVIENEFRWYLTGRLPVIVMPELAKRTLGDGPLWREFLLGEADEETIVPPEAYRGRSMNGTPRPVGAGETSGGAEPTGSNNWVVSGQHTQSGKPMVASDPHIAIEAISCWYEVHLSGGDFQVMGMAYVGMPAVLAGRNERVAWGITNNICSLRDLYQEKTDPEHPNCFLFDGTWEPAREITETITVKDREPVTRTIRFSRNGPIVDEILPDAAKDTGPVALRWLGAEQGGWLTALLGMNQADSVDNFRQALEPWYVPTFNLVVADLDGHIAVQCAGRIPQRRVAERGYRPGWDPEHQWTGLLPFEELPGAIDPPRGWLASANNRLVGNDYPYPVFGTWSSGYRALRIRQLLEEATRPSREGGEGVIDQEQFRTIQYDTLSLRAVNCLEPLMAAIRASGHPQAEELLRSLEGWDGHITADRVAPTLLNVFFAFWTLEVVGERFSGAIGELLAKQAEGMASRLLAADSIGWFAPGRREAALQRAVTQTVNYLTERLGPEVASWTWGRIHQLPMRHFLSGRGDLGVLLDQHGGPVDGDMVTVCNTGSGPDFSALTGAGYRMIVDLAASGLWALDGQSQSGHPGSVHYHNQLESWRNGQYHFLSMERSHISASATERFVLRPSSSA